MCDLLGDEFRQTPAPINNNMKTTHSKGKYIRYPAIRIIQFIHVMQMTYRTKPSVDDNFMLAGHALTDAEPADIC